MSGKSEGAAMLLSMMLAVSAKWTAWSIAKKSLPSVFVRLVVESLLTLPV
jgi:hypothetical protein